MENKIKKILRTLYLYELVKFIVLSLHRLIMFSFNFLLKLKQKIYYIFHPVIIIFLYHRVANVKDDPHLLSVSPENFYRQMEYLKQNFNIIKLYDLGKKLKNKQIKKKTAIITFDDGYADNLYNALPILEKFKIPATIFITAGKINSPNPFYWDKNTKERDRGRALTSEELVKLSRNPLIEIGAHTLTHPYLSKIIPDFQKKEIFESKQIIESIIKKPVISFSYPFGGKNDFSKTTVNLVKKAGYNYACANNLEKTLCKKNLFRLPRHLIRNWEISDFKKYVKKLY